MLMQLSQLNSNVVPRGTVRPAPVCLESSAGDVCPPWCSTRLRCLLEQVLHRPDDHSSST